MKNSLYLIILVLSICSCKTLKQSDRQLHPSSPPTMGWASWNHFHININEEIIKSQANAMVDLGLRDIGYKFINIDDGFYGGRDSTGNILINKQKFPNGMKVVSDYIHAKKLMAGIYTDAGINTCGSKGAKDTLGVGMGLFGHDEQDLNLYLKKWNYDFIKIDWCGGVNAGLDDQIRYTEIGNKIRQIKPSAIYNVCRWKFPGNWVTQVADSWRISGDIANNFKSVLKIIDLNADLWRFSTYGHYNDMDMLQVGRGMTYDEDKTHFSMWCMMQSPLLLGNDLTKMSKQTLEIISNKELIDLDQSKFVYQARRLVDDGDLEIWGRPLFSTMSGEVAVALLNRSEKAEKISLNTDSIGIDNKKGYVIKDLWTKENYPSSSANEISREVPPHGIVVLKIKGTAKPYNRFQFSDAKMPKK
ncbi:glycoside hydrolase family 27 protein [Pedobacter sp. SD-b]|uniref:Alpha-galactosidase n=1 Tax=Pedobacter segetis TaxID=2793069 RepID=A0ABS1BHV4_9SPHI|nr:glycoside hydrolase family 27 protein [Pedobacter segetis]MBK0381941.1 glycoside hydrolase family 27 protein [Pedobacter segetis]